MRIKIKKIIMCGVVSGAMMIPIIVSAASGYLSGGIGVVNRYSSNAWADYEHYMVNAETQKYDVRASATGWGHCQTINLEVRKSCIIRAQWGYNGKYISSAVAYQ